MLEVIFGSREIRRNLPAYYLLYSSFFLDLFFYPEGGGDMFLRNFSCLSTDYTPLYPRIHTLHNHCLENTKSYKHVMIYRRRLVVLGQLSHGDCGGLGILTYRDEGNKEVMQNFSARNNLENNYFLRWRAQNGR
jgi:hypothetical protein